MKAAAFIRGGGDKRQIDLGWPPIHALTLRRRGEIAAASPSEPGCDGPDIKENVLISKTMIAAVAALTLAGALAPAMSALAEDHRGEDRGGDRRDHRGGGDGGLIAGLALGAALGSYAGRPYYCRDHHHWRWSRRYNRYVSYSGGHC